MRCIIINVCVRGERESGWTIRKQEAVCFTTYRLMFFDIFKSLFCIEVCLRMVFQNVYEELNEIHFTTHPYPQNYILTRCFAAEDLKLVRGTEHYSFLNTSGCVEVDTIDDGANFETVLVCGCH